MKHYTKEFKEQVLKEIQDVGNISLVCKKHELKPSTVHTWIKRDKNKDQIAEAKQSKEYQRKIKDLELEVAVLKSLLKKTYPLWNSEKPLS